jgi:hypothetical protein
MGLWDVKFDRTQCPSILSPRWTSNNRSTKAPAYRGMTMRTPATWLVITALAMTIFAAAVTLPRGSYQSLS